jgi:hypothetical protein
MTETTETNTKSLSLSAAHGLTVSALTLQAGLCHCYKPAAAFTMN